MSRRSFARGAAAMAVSALTVAFAAVAAEKADEPTKPPKAVPKDQPKTKSDAPTLTRDELLGDEAPWRDEWTPLIDKWFAAYDLTPRPIPSIPDNPPPHEGALIGFPLVVQPPDLLLVELLEGLPGRPLSGERLIRPDGMINLGFYGEVQVRGLTLPQVKVAIIKHLRKYLSDDILGLRFDPPEPAADLMPPELPLERNPFGKEEEPEADKKPAPAPARREGVRPRLVHPEDSTRIFVDITAYNSLNYYITGDVTLPGKLPVTGQETVLDALQYAGGLIATAEPRDIRLVRPGRDGKPSRVYKVDLEAIQEKGDVQTNYQLFPGDRLIVGRNEVVKKTIEIDRLQAPVHAIVSSIQQDANLLKSLGVLSPEKNEQVLKDLVDFWAKEVSRKGELKFDEQTLREILLHQLKTKTGADAPGPGPGAR